MHRLFLIMLLIVVSSTISFSQSPGKKDKTDKSSANAKSPINFNRDTIPLGKYKYFRADGASKIKYIIDGISEDSVRMIKANKVDWAEFNKTYDELKRTFSIDRFKNVESYIDTPTDLVELTLLNQNYFYNTTKVGLQQLTFNLRLLNQMLTTPIREKTEVEALNMVIKNIDLLVTRYIATKGLVFYMIKTTLPNLKFKVFDKAGAPVTNAKCYIVSYKTCRDIACRTCVPALEPCELTTVSSIVNKADFVFDCNNPVNIKVNYGNYHVFVISNNKIRHYEPLHFVETSVSGFGTNEIKVIASK
ncbi:MAG: hypothetical protein ABIN67_03250 [Ferruginibacter sp.]